MTTAYLHQTLGLAQLRLADRNAPWAKARDLATKKRKCGRREHTGGCYDRMMENLYPNLDQILAPLTPVVPRESILAVPKEQSFREYRQSEPARKTLQRQAIFLSLIGELTPSQEAIVAATGDYLGCFFDLPVQRGRSFNPAIFPAYLRREHPLRKHPQFLIEPLINEVLLPELPDEALIYLGATARDLCSNEYGAGRFGSDIGEAWYGRAGIWSLFYLGNPAKSADTFRGCLKRSCAVAAHEALHVLGLDHCSGVPCLMRSAGCLSGPLLLCPPCLRKLSWNRQFELVPYFDRLENCLRKFGFGRDAERAGLHVSLLAKKPWKKGRRPDL